MTNAEKTIAIGLPSGNIYYDGNKEYSRYTYISYTDKESDLIEQIDQLSDDFYDNGDVIAVFNDNLSITTPCSVKDLISSILYQE